MSAQIPTSSNKKQKSLSIVIVNWNTREFLRKCLASVYAYPPNDEFEIWVVDNASSDGSTEMVKQSFPSVNLIENQHNPGFAGANNQAIRQSQAEFVLLLNPDTEVLPGALATMLDFMKAFPKVGASGSRILNPDRTLQTSCYPYPTLFGEFWRLFHLDVFWAHGVYHMQRWPLDTHRKVDVLLGAFLLIRSDVLDKIGLMSEDYFMYTEEVDLCYRITKNGWEIYWVPKAEIIHYGGQSTRQVSRQMFIQLYKSKVLYFKKHHGILSAFIYKLILLIASLSRIALSPFAVLDRSPARQQRIELAHNYQQLVKVLFSS